jgi:signal transduction histidine kinase
MKQYGKAEQYLNSGLALARKLGYPKDIHLAADGLYQVYKFRKQTDQALTMLELSKKMNDSIQNTNTSRAALKSQFNYEYEKKAIADSLKTAGQRLLLQAELSQAKTQRYLLITGIALVVVVAGFILYRIRLTQKLSELKFRNKIASDLHDDVGSALSSISIFSEVARQKLGGNNDDVRQSVEKIGDISRSILEDMSDIIWAISPRNDSVKTLQERMESFGKSLLAEIGIDFHLSVDDGIADLKLGTELRKNLYLIFKEGINNAVKYSKAKQINVSMKLTGKSIQLSIADNGIGFHPEHAKKGNGLENMRQRAHEIGAMFEIRSALNEGTLLNLNFRTT